jgi:transmembrane sensor
MTKKEILDLLKDERFCNYCLGKDPEDTRYWEQWLEDHPEERAQVEAQKMLVVLMENEVAASEADRQFQLLKHRIRSVEVGRKPIVRHLYPVFAKWAVAAIFIVIAGVTYYNYQKPRPVVLVGKNDNMIGPATNNASLTLSDGSNIHLTNTRNTNLATQPGTKLTIEQEGKLVYIHSGHSGQTPAINVLATPAGGKYTLQLPDGTTVYLSAASSLRYPTSFENLGERTVELTGEAFFDVKHDAKHPFMVKAARQSIQDIGTSFDIRSYAGDSVTKTTLVTGLVRVTSSASPAQQQKTVLLNPGQQASQDAMGNLTVGAADTAGALAWKNGYFYFNNADIKSVMREISRWYDVEIAYPVDLSTDNLNGKISRNLNLSQVLENLASTQIVHFKTQGRTISVFK